MSGTTAAAPKTTKTLVWNAVESAAAADKKLYLRIEAGGKRGQNSTRSLAGAERSWKKFPGVIYIPDRNYRLSGTPEDISTVLRQSTTDEGLIAQILATAITSENYVTPKSQGGAKETFEGELQEYRALSKMSASAGPSIANFDLSDACRFADQYREYRKQNKGKVLVAGSKGKAASGKNRVVKIQPNENRVSLSLHEMVVAVHTQNTEKGTNKVIDVSQLAKGGDPRTVSRLVAGKDKVGGSVLPIVSNNLESYIQAVQSLDAGEGVDPLVAYQAEVEAVRAGLQASGAPALEPMEPAALVSAAPVVTAAPVVAAAPAAPSKGLISVKSPVGGLSGARAPSSRGIKSVGGDKAAAVPALKK